MEEESDVEKEEKLKEDSEKGVGMDWRRRVMWRRRRK